MKVNLFSVKGEEKGKVELPDNLFGEVSDNLLSQVLRFYEFNFHKVRPHKKTRADVDISTRKIYRQKGTGGARHGARSAPIFVGGGLAHGPSGLKKVLRLPKSVKRKALSLLLLDKVKGNRFFLVEDLSSLRKTREASSLVNSFLSKLGLTSTASILAVFKAEDKEKTKAWSNLSNVKIASWESLNAFRVFNSDLIVLDSKIFETKEGKKKKVLKKQK